MTISFLLVVAWTTEGHGGVKCQWKCIKSTEKEVGKNRYGQLILIARLVLEQRWG